MKKFPNIGCICLLLALGIVSLPIGLSAAVTDSSLSTQTPSVAKKRSRWRLKYKAWFTGSRLRDFDGSKKRGILLSNYFKPAYYLGGGWMIRAVGRVNYRFGNAKGTKRNVFGNPGIGIFKKGILKERKHGISLSALTTYFVPLSSYARDSDGTSHDQSNGTLMLYTYFSKSFGDFWIGLSQKSRRYFSKNPTFDSYNYYFELLNTIGWNVGQNTSVYVGYNNYITRWRDGIGSPWAEQHTVDLGMSYNFTRRLSVNPYLESPFMLKDTTFSFVVNYRIL